MRWALAALAFILLCISDCAQGGVEDTLPQIVGVRVGIGGAYKAGLWTPVEVLLRGGRESWSGQIAAIAPDGDGVPCRFVSPADPAFRVGPWEFKSVELYVKFGRTEPAMTVQLRQSQSADAQVERVFKAGSPEAPSVFRRALRSTDGLIVVVGPETLAVDETFAGLRQLAGGRTVPVRLPDATQLPSRWCGYEGVATVVLTTSNARAYAVLKSDSPQVVALEQWVRMGGAMLLCAGRNAEAALGAGSPLARFSPGRLVRRIPLRKTGAIEAYCGSSVQIFREGPVRQGLSVPQLADIEGTVEAREGNLPLVVRRTLGFGNVLFAAFDLDAPPLGGWSDRGLLVGKLLDAEEALPEDSHASGAVLHYGYDDMAGQLRSALDQFAEVPFVPFWIVVTLVIGYLALIGPGDYFFLRRIAGRMTLTWITFPLVVTVFCVGAYVLAHRFKGDQVRANQVDLVDVDLASGRARGSSWATVFSPRAGRSSLAFEARQSDGHAVGGEEIVACWLGLPGEAFGGMDPKTAAPAVWKETYDCSPRLDALVGVPMPTWSTKSFAARWSTPRWRPRTAGRLEARIVEQNRIPVGTITNLRPTDPDLPGLSLSECLLCYGRWAYRLGDLAPGESATVGPTSERRDLTTLLTGRRLLFEEGVQRATPYDRGSVDVTYIVRAMMFFKAAGGHHYTGLAARHQAFVDLSDLLKSNRAILVAIGPTADPKSPHHGARLLCDGQPLEGPHDRHTTIYRFVVPVGKDEG